MAMEGRKVRRARVSAPDRRARRVVAPALAVLVALIIGVGWALSSPLSSSPDDDYHLGSIWCPRPVEGSCETSQIDGVPVVRVPRAVSDASMTCFAFTARSAGCAIGYDDDDLVWSTRFDDGDYPVGYYWVHHLLVGHDVQTSAILMRSST